MSIILENLTKRFGENLIVNNVSLEIRDGEFFVLLGSSGSGKTTILNIIAGLVPVDQGRVILHGRDVTFLPPQDRRVGLVFQHYALFQQMTVADNIDFGPSIHKVPMVERRRRREELLDLVGLTGLETRYPRQLSGGQQQRVALARALAHQPEVLLLDEPFGALDARIRVELRRTLRSIQRKLNITTILVTHDQEEAFDLADRIGVMNFGRLLEVGTPTDLYQQPQSEFVASFLGKANLFVTNAVQGGVQIGAQVIPLPERGDLEGTQRRIQVLFRPEDVALASSAQDLDCAMLGVAEVEEIAFIGTAERLYLRMAPIPGVRPIEPLVPFGARWILIEAARTPDQAARLSLLPGDRVWIGIRRLHVLSNTGFHYHILTDGSPGAQSALITGGNLARLTYARVTLLGYNRRADEGQEALQEARRQLSSGINSVDVHSIQGDLPKSVARVAQRQPADIVVLGYENTPNIHLVKQIMQAGEHHLLLTPCAAATFNKILVYVTSGEPGRDIFHFPGRLAQHLGASITLMAVLPRTQAQDPKAFQHSENFLESGAGSISLYSVETNVKIRTGAAVVEINEELGAENYDLLVMGVFPDRLAGDGHTQDMINQVLSQVNICPVLLIQPHIEKKPIATSRIH